jgi:threonine dehydrogenase-like Zn-dependent dehydrogenase
MKAIVIVARQRAELVEQPDDTVPLKPDEVAGKTRVTLVSPGTELNYWSSDRAQPVGYAAVMTVDAVGADVRDIHLGDRVYCSGLHASRQRFPRARVCIVPADLADEVAVFCRLMGVGWSTLATTAARPGNQVLITGLGPIGNCCAQVFSAAGYLVTAVDPDAERRRLAQSLGLGDVREKVPLAENRKDPCYQMAIDCSGFEQAVIDCAQVVRRGGEVVMIGAPWRRRSDAYAWDLLSVLFNRYVTLRSGLEWQVPMLPRDFTPSHIIAHYAMALRWLSEGRLRTDGLASRAVPSDAQAVYQSLQDHSAPAPTVIFDWSAIA